MITISKTEYKDGKWKTLLSSGQIVFIEGATESDEEAVLKSFQSLVDSKNRENFINL